MEGPLKGKKTGGRRPGSKNKRTINEERVLAQAVEKLAGKAFKGDALAFLRSVYKGTLYPFETRLDAAKAALPFEMAKPSGKGRAAEEGFVPLVERLRYYARRDAIEASKNKVVELKQPAGRDDGPP